MKVENKWALPFAAWELRLYLDTHPYDQRALATYRQICAATGPNYACATPQGMTSGTTPSCRGTDGEAESWAWIEGPWPWQVEANIVESEA